MTSSYCLFIPANLNQCTVHTYMTCLYKKIPVLKLLYLSLKTKDIVSFQ